MLAIAALTGPLPKLGVVILALFAAAALLVRDPRARARAFGGAIVLAPVLLVAEIWSSPQLGFVHRHAPFAVVGAVLAVAALAGVAAIIDRRPAALALLAVAALPFRVPIDTGGKTSNLLVPLYLVVAAGAFALIWRELRAPRKAPAPDPAAAPATTLEPTTARGRAQARAAERRMGSRLRSRPATVGARADEVEPGSRAGSSGPGIVERLLALYIVLYALQAVYSPDFESALQNMVFFYVPFALLYVLLMRLQWTPRLIRQCFTVIVALALISALIGFAEYETKTIFLNTKLIVANDLHTYFTINSLFIDPNIFGRFLMLVMIGLATVLLFQRRPREQVGATLALAVLWAALVLTLSRSSLAALLVGLVIIAALRWQIARAAIVAAVIVCAGVAAVVISPTTFGLNQGLNGASSGHVNLATRGIHMFSERPLWGYGSGSFETEYQRQYHGTAQTVSASHTIAVTIAAEQGLIGELVYLALIVTAVVRLLRGARSDPARVAILAAFVALVFHTLLYADFLEDPVTWALLAVGSALALAAPGRVRGRERERRRAAVGT